MMDAAKQNRGYVLGVLAALNVFSYVDRYLPSILLPSIRRDLDLNDSELAFITGAAFALFYAIMCLPLGRMADKYRRVSVLAICVGLWSIMTTLTGFTRSFWQLFAVRLGVGIGEAGLNPSAQSMISDMFAEKGRRATANAVFSAGISVGTLIAFLFGGNLDQVFGWRMAFVILGIPGVMLAALVFFTLREPTRGAADHFVDVGAPPPLWETVKTMWNIRVWRYMMFGTGFSGLCNTCTTVWAPSYLSRSFHLTTAQTANFLSPALGLGGVIGTFFGGIMVDHLRLKNPRWGSWLPMVTLGLTVIPMILIFTADNATTAILLFTIPLVLVPTHLSCFSVVSQGVAPLRIRGTAPALSLLVTAGIIGLGFGPQVIGGLSDLLKPHYGEESLRYALLIVAPLSALTASFFFYLGSRTITQDLAAAAALQGGSASVPSGVR